MLLLETPFGGAMILEQHYLACLAQASYFIADESSGVAAVVDPRRDVDEYLKLARERGLRIAHVLLTHFHADFLAGHLELRERCGARLHLGARARAEFDFEPMTEGQGLELGPQVRLAFLETPGHTPESTSILVFDRERSESRPHAVLTGDTLFIGDVGRPDLMASVGVTAAELAASMYDSLREKLLKLPDETLVYPGHGAGSMCGKNLSTDTVSTIGAQRASNYALQPMEREAFIALLTANQPQAPAYFAFDANLNRKERDTLDVSLARSLRPLDLETVLARQNAGVQVLDTRDPEEFARGHLVGSLGIGLGGKFATWCGTMVEPARSIVIVAQPGSEREAALRLGRIGYDQVEGYLEGGPGALATRPDLVQRFERVDPDQLAASLASEDAPLVVDIRATGERENGAIEGSLHIPLQQLEERLDELPRDRRLVLQCQSGYRSSIAASLLLAAGFSELCDLRGGYGGWSAASTSACS